MRARPRFICRCIPASHTVCSEEWGLNTYSVFSEQLKDEGQVLEVVLICCDSRQLASSHYAFFLNSLRYSSYFSSGSQGHWRNFLVVYLLCAHHCAEWDTQYFFSSHAVVCGAAVIGLSVWMSRHREQLSDFLKITTL